MVLCILSGGDLVFGGVKIGSHGNKKKNLDITTICGSPNDSSYTIYLWVTHFGGKGN